MRRVAVFTEGQTELIFIRELLLILYDCSKFSLDCVKLHSGNMQDVPYSHPCSNAQVHFMIVNVQNDEAVVSAIRDREKELFRQGYDKIIGLRDMYSEAYRKRSPSGIDHAICKEFADGAASFIAKMTSPHKITLHFAIMEIEAWFLSMYNLFERLHPDLSVDHIHTNLKFNLASIDPQTEFYHPTIKIDDIFGLVGWQYQKKRSDTEKLLANTLPQDFEDATKNGRCSAFKVFLQDIASVAP